MSSPPSKQPEEIIEAIIDRLDEKVLKKLIDEPIDKAVQNFRYEYKEQINHRQIQKILSAFAAHIYKEGLEFSFVPNTLAFTIPLLDRHYQGNFSNGFTAAILDAGSGKEDDIKIVLHRIAEIIKTAEREKYIGGIFTTSIDISDWHLKCRIVEILLARYKSYLIPEIQNCSPQQLVDEIPYLLSIIINNISTLQQTIDPL
ncbi:MAG: hypothetical protein ABIG61_07780 [Planctomycetota bacterium]